MNLHDKYQIDDLTEFLGFLTAVYLKDKTGEEINRFFGLENDLSESE